MDLGQRDVRAARAGALGARCALRRSRLSVGLMPSLLLRLLIRSLCRRRAAVWILNHSGPRAPKHRPVSLARGRV